MKKKHTVQNLGPLVVCKHCGIYTRTIKVHLRLCHSIRRNPRSHYYTIEEWKLVKVQKVLERLERESRRIADPNYIPCGTKLNDTQFTKIIYTPMGGSNKKY